MHPIVSILILLAALLVIAVVGAALYRYVYWVQSLISNIKYRLGL